MKHPPTPSPKKKPTLRERAEKYASQYGLGSQFRFNALIAAFMAGARSQAWIARAAARRAAGGKR